MPQLLREDFTEKTDQLNAIQSIRTQGGYSSYFIETYGCQMNENDSERLAGLLEEMGLTPVSTPAEADIVMLNTCCVREKAELKVFGNVAALRMYKDIRPGMIIGVCGCMMQQPGVADEILKRNPHVNFIFGTQQIQRFPSLLLRAMEEKDAFSDINVSADTVIEHIPTTRKAGVRAWVSIMYGCNNFCSYCIVPYVRGRERSRLPKDVLQEVTYLVRNGYKEVSLLGQNVNSYGNGLAEECSFPQLLQKISEIEGLQRIRFMTSHPKDLSDALINAIAALPKVCKHIHLPMQAGSWKTLQRMNRKYNPNEYENLVAKLRKAVPGIAVTTDLIVGFPGETDSDFIETLKTVSRIRFDAAFTFAYSPRKGTPAAKMDKQVPELVKKKRLAALIALQESISAEKLADYANRTVDVLVEQVSQRDKSMVAGRTETDKMVHFRGSVTDIGKIIPVHITQVKAHTLMGEIT
ncbi:MAG: tRNA (N6-isopentenyl adenosine(37)-C2)-methylthiotransferase MiaB [Christensenellales bacterium]|jgi:tRNA-2-methylthio-N6-dimethylallyladenosine synthase